MQFSHPSRITGSKVIIYRNDMHASARKRIKICRKSRNKRFSFTGLHLRYASLMKYYSTYQLHAVMLHTKHSSARLTHNGERLGKKIFKRFSITVAFFKLLRLALKLIIRKCKHGRTHFFYLVHYGVNSF